MRLFIKASYEKIRALKKVLYMRGYDADWDTDDVLNVDMDDYEDIIDIINDMGILILDYDKVGA